MCIHSHRSITHRSITLSAVLLSAVVGTMLPAMSALAQPGSDAAYRASVLPAQVTARVAIEMGIEQGWEKYLGPRGRFIGMNRYGASAPGGVLAKTFGFTVENVLKVAKETLTS